MNGCHKIGFVQRMRFDIIGGEGFNRDFLKRRAMALYSITADFMNLKGIKEFNDNYDKIGNMPEDIELYDELYDMTFRKLSDSISKNFSAALDGNKRVYLGKRSAFIFDPNTLVTTMTILVE